MMPTSRYSRTPHNNKGFTLIEVTIVITIIMVLVSIVSPKLKGVAESSKLKSTARTIRSLLTFARDVAITEGSDYLVAFDMDNQTFWLTDRTGLEQGDLSLTSQDIEQETGVSSISGTLGDEETQTSISRTSMILGIPQSPSENVIIIAMETNHEAGNQLVQSGTDYVPFSMVGTSEPATIYLASANRRYMAIKVQRSGAVAIEQVDEALLQSLGIDLSILSPEEATNRR